MDVRQQLIEALAGVGEYGRRSARNIGIGVDNGRQMAQEVQSHVPPVVDRYAGMVSEFMPGSTVVDAMRYGGEAGRLWNAGNYADSLDRYGDAILAPLAEVAWIAPGGPMAKAPQTLRTVMK